MCFNVKFGMKTKKIKHKFCYSFCLKKNNKLKFQCEPTPYQNSRSAFTHRLKRKNFISFQKTLFN